MTNNGDLPRRVAAFLSTAYGLDATVSRLAGENDNYLVTAADGMRYVLKLAGEGERRETIELEQQAVESVRAIGLDLDLPHLVPARDGSVVSTFGRPDRPPRLARLLSFVAGTPWYEDVPASPERLAQAGGCIAQVANALASLDNPAAHRTHRWDLTRVNEHRRKTRLITDAARRRIADEAFLRWSACARPYLSELPHGLIHGDLNDENLLVTDGRLSGILDFSEALYNPLVCDLAIALAYLLLDEPDPLGAGAEIVAEYNGFRALTSTEIEVLFPLLCGRLAVSLVTACERRRIDPEREAWFVTEERAWPALERYVEIDPVEAADQLAVGTDIRVFTDRGATPEALLERRHARVCDALSLSYEEPVKFIRGRAAYLIDERGRPFLDLYNNVCHVGHCHPRVVAAGAQQLARLNTNTRYLYDLHLEYAERLCATLPPALDTCFFVNSGTEANELALRLARTHTGRRDLLVVAGAYHGHTTTLVEASPYKFRGPGGAGRAEPWVHVVPMPDGYRGPHRGQGRAAGVAYGDAVGEVIAALDRPIGAFLAESLLSCAGQVIPPEGYLETAFAHVRAAGGVCILDEVQIGFGRVGTHFWAFERQGVVPDIVVMGKPIGNGHPMGAVVCTGETAASFATTGMEFFSTFGGNPVSCAIGLAVLDVIRDEGLQAHALRLGTQLRDGLRALMEHHAVIGDVRGIGLFLGIELVEDRGTRAPATAAARSLVEGLRRRRILTGTDGPYENVVKIKPPLAVSEADAELAIGAVDEVLGEMGVVGGRMRD